MAEPPLRTHRPAPLPLPPPAPPLPPSRQASTRPGVLQRLVAPLGLGFGNRPPNVETNRSDSRRASPNPTCPRTYVQDASQKATHRTGIPIAALDISPNKQHAVLAGKEILKTVRVSNENVVEETNLRSAVTSYASTHGTDIANIPAPQNDYLAATDVKWSHSQYDTVIATAASNGRIVLYDIRKSEVELSRIHEHSRQVHRLAFSPFGAHLFLSASHDATTRLWDLRALSGERGTMTMHSIREFRSRADAARDVRWSPTDAYQFAVCTDAGTLSLWDIRHTNKVLNRLNAHEKPCYTLDWHPDGKHIVSAGLDRNVKVWEITNERRRQKPLLVMRAPQGVMNVRWRPASWSSEEQSTGDWQCTHLVTAYNQEDPRVHIWDLRRPLIPFREIDQYYSPPTDLLWHSKDLLWTVGNEGMFTQTDIKSTPESAEQISPCPKAWLPNGSLVSFSESVIRRKSSALDEELFELPTQKSSGEDKTGTSHSMTDDEAMPDNFLTSLKRRPGKALWSQDNTPPSRDERVSVLNLEQTLDKGDNERPHQVGMTIDLDMIALDVTAFRFLAEQYVKPMTARQRKERPQEILGRLDQAFSKNAEICDELLLHRLAQSWRIMGYVLIEDLRTRAELNREWRLDGKPLNLPKKSLPSSSAQEARISKPDSNGSNSDQQTKRLRSDDKKTLRGHGSDGLGAGLEKHRLGIELDSTSNMTTPLARPVPDTPFFDIAQLPPHHHYPENASQTLPALPQSLVHSHSTAAAASDALREGSSASVSSPDTSPQLDRSQSRFSGGTANGTSSAESVSDTNMLDKDKLIVGGGDGEYDKSSPLPATHIPSIDPGLGHHEDRRAALHDYHGQNRPILTFGRASDAPQNEFGNPVYRHDSNESFPMFSASTDSSFKARSLGESFESAGLANSRNSPTRHLGLSTLNSSSGSPESSLQPLRSQGISSTSYGNYQENARSGSDLEVRALAEQTPPTLPFSLEGLGDSLLATPDPSRERSERNYGTKTDSLSASLEVSPSEKLETSKLHRPINHALSRFDRTLSPTVKVEEARENGNSTVAEADMSSTELIYGDFERSQAVEGFSNGLFPWSPSRLLLSCLQADVRGHNGSTYCQFATQILFHVLPFYFAFSTSGNGVMNPTSTADDRMSRPFVESILLTYLEALKVHSLFVPAAEVRKFCKDHGFESAYATPLNDEETSRDKDHFVFATCKSCAEPLGGRNSGAQCSVCRNVRDPCPICLNSDRTGHSYGRPDFSIGGRDLWMQCQGCGHGGHTACMNQWLDLADSEGCCPTPFCGHDCGPGAARDRRVDNFIKAEAEASLVRGTNSQSGAKTDSWVIPQSAAVGQTRAVLSGRAGSGSGGSVGKKQVRLVTPGEQSLP